MNMTFNSRPGVKQYINNVVKKGSGVGNQLPKQGQRQNKHNGYNNFYFSSQKRGTLQRFNLLDTEKKTKVQHTLLQEAEKKEKLATNRSKRKFTDREKANLADHNQDLSTVDDSKVKMIDKKISKKYEVNTTFYSPMSST